MPRHLKVYQQYDLKKELMKIDKSINSCFDSGDEENARQYAMKKVTVQGKINTLKETIEEYKKEKEQQEIDKIMPFSRRQFREFHHHDPLLFCL